MDEPTRTVDENDPVLREAAQWAVELDSPDISLERMAQWQLWLSQDPRHAREFERIEQLLSRAGQIRTVPWPTQAELATDDDTTLSASSNANVSANAAVVIATRANNRKLQWGFALAASVALVVGALVFSGHPRSINLPGLLSYTRVDTQAGGTQKVV
ncbi:FecR/PupR family sigma factor regulator, partial [Steroidobacter sp.]|uniref:FecR/PupR family sigma factor regulator n=1 Tax=Steroidobacter sp. TaxID=1978227 RepID=UPI001A472521